MFAFKNRFINQKKAIIENFEVNFENNSNKLTQDEKSKLMFSFKQIKTESQKGLMIGFVISTFFYINMRQIKTFSKTQKCLFLLTPILITPIYYYLSFMEKFKTLELHLALKALN